MLKIKVPGKLNRYVFLYPYYYFILNKRSILFFLFVGTLSAVVNFASFTLLWKLMGINYQAAVSVAYLLSVIVHFIANRRLSFHGHHIHFLRQMPRYLIMILLNYFITLGVTQFVVEILHLTPYLGIMFAIGVTINTSYFMLRYWVFPRVIKEA